VLDDLNHRAEQRNREKPKAKAPTWRAKCWRENPPAGWRNTSALNPKMRRGLSGLPVCRKVDEHTRTPGLEWFGPPERNTLLHCTYVVLRVYQNLSELESLCPVTLCAFPFIV
jgi:hypothetical protein